jgi:hypothetical protein
MLPLTELYIASELPNVTVGNKRAKTLRIGWQKPEWWFSATATDQMLA